MAKELFKKKNRSFETILLEKLKESLPELAALLLKLVIALLVELLR